MLAAALVQEVERLLAGRAFSQRAIARRTGVSRGTVGAIAAGRRAHRERLPAEVDEEKPQGPPQRCPECGGMVYLPCRLCRARQKRTGRERTTRPIRAVEVEELVRLDLRPEHQTRYEQVRVWRREALAQGAACL